MRAWTLRNIPHELMQLFRQEARQRHMSINKTIVSLMLEKFGIARSSKKKTYHDLDAWFSKDPWTKEEADEFNKMIMEQRRRDAELFWNKTK
jgi:hypothetical protein